MATGVLVAGLALPTAVLADTTGGAPPIQPAFARNATIRVTSVAVTAKLIANIAITYTCQPFQVYDWETGQTIETTVGHIEGGQGVVIQAQGRSIAWGQSSDIFGGTAVCDGSTANSMSFPVTAVVSPWKSGTAVVGASIYLVDDNGQTSDFASTGPITVRLSNH
jgi:hypothetical protein